MITTHRTLSSDLYRKIKSKAREKQIFVDFDDTTLTYRELLDTIQRLVFFFQSRGLTIGTRIILLTRHDNHAILLFVAALLEGLTPIILSADAKSDRVRAIAGRVLPGCIFIDSELKDAWQWLERYCCIPITRDRRTRKGFLGKLFATHDNHSMQYPDLLRYCKKQEPSCSAKKDDIAYILFTSGTTSTPKGILTSHENVFEHLETLTRTFSYNSSKRIFNNMALAHADGLFQGPLLALFSGALLFRPQPFSVQDMELLFNTIYQKRITHFITVPTVLSLADRLLGHDDYFIGKDFGHIISVAAKLDPHLWQRLEKRFKVRICNMYGLSETVSGGVFCGPDDSTFAIGTIGKPIDMEARIVNDKSKDCLMGEEGELWLKGKNVIPGYLDEPEATAALFAGDWLRTGDIARLRSDGRIEIVGRIKAVIISGGFNIFPDEITEILRLHPDVDDAVTVGISDRDWGELVVCAVESEKTVDEGQLINHCRLYLENYKVPRRIIQFKKLPRGISGKARLQEIRISIEKDLIGAGNGEEKIDIAEIIALASVVFNSSVDRLGPDLPPQEIPGWDSLGHLNLIAAVEQKFKVQFAVEEMMRVDSLQSLHDILLAKV